MNDESRPQPQTRASRPHIAEYVSEPLRDEAGQPYDPQQLPCWWLPEMWDADASTRDKHAAKRLCLSECPALGPCRNLRRTVAKDADGVWAGSIIHRPRTPPEPDHRALRMAAELGISIEDIGK